MVIKTEENLDKLEVIFERYCLNPQRQLNRLTISDLTAQAGVHRVSFYKWFANLLDFIKWYLHKDLIFKIQDQKVLTLETALTLVYEFVIKKRTILSKIFTSQYALDAQKFIFDETLTYQMMNFSKIDTNTQIPTQHQRTYARFYASGITHLIVDYILQPEAINYDLKTYLTLSVRLIKNYIERMIALDAQGSDQPIFKS
jgi:AcrR family transcriptional regulator